MTGVENSIRVYCPFPPLHMLGARYEYIFFEFLELSVIGIQLELGRFRTHIGTNTS
jgi:hypothetical protein